MHPKFVQNCITNTYHNFISRICAIVLSSAKPISRSPSWIVSSTEYKCMFWRHPRQHWRQSDWHRLKINREMQFPYKMLYKRCTIFAKFAYENIKNIPNICFKMIPTWKKLVKHKRIKSFSQNCHKNGSFLWVHRKVKSKIEYTDEGYLTRIQTLDSTDLFHVRNILMRPVEKSTSLVTFNPFLQHFTSKHRDPCIGLMLVVPLLRTRYAIVTSSSTFSSKYKP